MPGLEDEFGDVVRKTRDGLGISQDSLSQITSISVEHIADFERYRRTPSERECDALAAALHLHPASLWQLARDAYDPGAVADPPGVAIRRFVFSGMSSNGYVLRLDETGVTLLVDPGGDPRPVLEYVKEQGGRLDAVLLTHGHEDHVAGLAEVRAAHPVPVYARPEEWDGDGLVSLRDVSHVSINGARVDVLPSPGHTPAGVVFHVAGVAAVGDTLFAGSLGRAYQGRREYYDLLLSSARTILDLSPNTLLLPGHGPLTTVALERKNNPCVAGFYEPAD